MVPSGQHLPFADNPEGHEAGGGAVAAKAHRPSNRDWPVRQRHSPFLTDMVPSGQHLPFADNPEGHEAKERETRKIKLRSCI